MALKVAAALKQGLLALVCIGETKKELVSRNTRKALERQTRALLEYVGTDAPGKVVIAYEPVWSIGEGGTPASPDFANEQHEHIKRLTKEICGAELPVLYGGSVNLENCRALIAEPKIDGLFIGRAAWKVEGFLDIIDAVSEIAKG